VGKELIIQDHVEDWGKVTECESCAECARKGTGAQFHPVYTDNRGRHVVLPGCFAGMVDAMFTTPIGPCSNAVQKRG